MAKLPTDNHMVRFNLFLPMGLMRGLNDMVAKNRDETMSSREVSQSSYIRQAIKEFLEKNDAI